MIHLNLQKEIVLIEVEEGDKKFVVEGNILFWEDRYGLDDNCKYLPKGSWSQPIKCNEVSEETAAGIVESRQDSDSEGEGEFMVNYEWIEYFNYVDREYNSEVGSPLQSFYSLLKANNLPIDNTILLIKQ